MYRIGPCTGRRRTPRPGAVPHYRRQLGVHRHRSGRYTSTHTQMESYRYRLHLVLMRRVRNSYHNAECRPARVKRLKAPVLRMLLICIYRLRLAKEHPMSESSAGRGEVSIEFSVLLWCMRVFVDPPGQDWAGQDEAGQDGAEAHIEATLRQMGAADAAPAFCRFMAVIRDTLPRTAKVSRVRWRSGGNDEHVRWRQSPLPNSAAPWRHCSCYAACCRRPPRALHWTTRRNWARTWRGRAGFSVHPLPGYVTLQWQCSLRREGHARTRLGADIAGRTMSPIAGGR